jgi:hypothetical protein
MSAEQFSAEQFVEQFCGVLFTEPGWESPLTMERLHELLKQTLAEFHAGTYR